jgi:hypothetical protein
MIFSRGKLRRYEQFKYGGTDIETVQQFRYLGIEFNYNGKFQIAMKQLFQQSQRAMFSILAKSRKLGLPIDIQLQMFDHIVTPILLYGVEAWGHENTGIIEKLHLRFCRILLNANKNTAKCMIYGELGRTDLNVKIKGRMVSYWAKMLNSKDHKLNKLFYNLLYALDKNKLIHSGWIVMVKTTLNECGLYNLWLKQRVENVPNLVNVVKQKLTSNFENDWLEEVQSSGINCVNYRLFKHKLDLEPYLLKLPFAFRKSLTKFRIVNHKLPIEKDRYVGIIRENRLCNTCNTLGDEYHYVFCCTTFAQERKQFLTKYYYNRPNTLKFDALFNTLDVNKLIKLAKFTKSIMNIIN